MYNLTKTGAVPSTELLRLVKAYKNETSRSALTAKTLVMCKGS
jgi:hypothetical protein